MGAHTHYIRYPMIKFSHRFASGSYVSLLSNPIMDLGVVDDVGRRVGMFMSILSLGALAGPPISGAINSATGGFVVVGYYAGKYGIIFFSSYSDLFDGRLGYRRWCESSVSYATFDFTPHDWETIEKE